MGVLTDIFHGVYVIIVQILLINLLIALFTSTYDEINKNSTQLWKFERYRLVKEYYFKPQLPPPFIFISHILNYFKKFNGEEKNENTKNRFRSEEKTDNGFSDSLLSSGCKREIPTIKET